MRYTSAPTLNQTHKTQRRRGFTLVEVMAISPVIILLVMVIVTFMVVLTGDALMSRERTVMVHDMQSGLDQVEMDIRLATKILSTTGTLASPQGSNNGTAPFVSSNNVLVLEQHSTSLHPADPSRSPLFMRDTPHPCGPLQVYNQPLKHIVVYFIDDNKLLRRTIIDYDYRGICSPVADGSSIQFGRNEVWQRDSCADELAAGRCATVDTVVADNITSMNNLYYDSPQLGSSRPSPSNATIAVKVTLTGAKQVAGADVSHTATVTATSIQQ